MQFSRRLLTSLLLYAYHRYSWYERNVALHALHMNLILCSCLQCCLKFVLLHVLYVQSEQAVKLLWMWWAIVTRHVSSHVHLSVKNTCYFGYSFGFTAVVFISYFSEFTRVKLWKWLIRVSVIFSVTGFNSRLSICNWFL